VHLQPAQAGAQIRDSLREDAAELHRCRRDRLCVALAANIGNGGSWPALVVGALFVDGAVDMSATFVIHVDASTVIIFVNIATTASKSSLPRSWRGCSMTRQTL